MESKHPTTVDEFVALFLTEMPVKVVLHRTEGDTAEWLDRRHGGLGGSDIARAAAVSDWGGPLFTYLTKRRLLPDGPQSEAAEWGHRLEDVVRQKAAEAIFAPITPMPVMLSGTGENEWMLADLDGGVVHPIWGLGGYEGKTCSAYKKHDWDDGKIPDDYWCQGQWYMGVTGLPYFIFAVLIGGNKFRWYKVDRDDRAIASLQAIGRRLWFDNILPGVQPEPAGSDDPGAYFTTPATDADAPVDLPLNLLPLVQQRAEAAAALDEAKAQLDRIEQQVTAALGDHTTGTLPGFVVSWGFTPGRKTLDGKKLAADHPEIHAAYTKVGNPFRTFKIKEVRES